MARGVSIHIGLNRVDPNCYEGWDGALAGCINDAQSMETIARSQGFAPQTLIDEEATADAVVSAIDGASSDVGDGDILLLTYSGHGGEVPDPTGTEATGMNQTWVLFDRMLIDDELYALFAHFGSGVRIFVLSDSCHSGTVTRTAMYHAALQGNRPLRDRYGKRAARRPPAFRAIPLAQNQKVYRQYRLMYDTISRYTPKNVDPSASVLLISGCQDNQLSADGDTNGLFTEKLLLAWGSGAYQGAYRDFHRKIVDTMPPTQVPNYYVVGQPSTDFEAQRPFTVDGTATGGTDTGEGEGGGAWGDWDDSASEEGGWTPEDTTEEEEPADEGGWTTDEEDTSEPEGGVTDDTGETWAEEEDTDDWSSQDEQEEEERAMPLAGTTRKRKK
jgi:hypothetical protein